MQIVLSVAKIKYKIKGNSSSYRLNDIFYLIGLKTDLVWKDKKFLSHSCKPPLRVGLIFFSTLTLPGGLDWLKILYMKFWKRGKKRKTSKYALDLKVSFLKENKSLPHKVHWIKQVQWQAEVQWDEGKIWICIYIIFSYVKLT